MTSDTIAVALGYVTQILDDARVYANYAKKIKTIEMDDVKLAVHMMMERSFTTPPPRDVSCRLLSQFAVGICTHIAVALEGSWCIELSHIV